MAQTNIIIICGEASGDLNAGSLCRAIKGLDPRIKISAVGGTQLRGAGAEIFYDIKGLAVIGFFDVMKKLPKFFALKKIILQKIKKEKPDAVILTDFSGFNLRLAKAINKSVPTIYYVSPQVWASRPGRVAAIKKYIHRIIVLFKFEEEFYKKHGIDANFLGHPLLDTVVPELSEREFFARFFLVPDKITLALLPGSRKQEIKNILPVMLKASVLIAREIKSTQVIIAKTPQVNWDIYNRNIHGLPIDVRIIEGKTYDCLHNAHFCMVASGTATLETALMQRPFVIIYKMGLLNYLLYRPQVKLPYIGMVNIVAGRKIIPEFIQFQASAENIARQILKTLKDPLELKQMEDNLAQIKPLLGEKGASLRAAKIILDYIKDQLESKCKKGRNLEPD